MQRLLLVFGISILLFACKKEEAKTSSGLPSYFPAIDYPADNLPSPERIALGKRLFYDPILSIDSSISCATCHKQQLAFADNQATTPGVNGQPGTRNVPSLANVAFQPYFLREGALPTLEMQVLVPIQEHNEFNHNIVEIAALLQKDSFYVEASAKAYNRLPNAFVITRAIAAFERTIVSYQSRFDQAMQGEVRFSDSEWRGRELFYSEKTNCSKCHGGFNFTNYATLNNGLYKTYQDPGRGRFTRLKKDSATFKVPSLRNVALTPPFMHDGSLSTLEDVLIHYASGGKGHENQSPLVSGFTLSETEKHDLIAFLKTLSDYSLLTNQNLR